MREQRAATSEAPFEPGLTTPSEGSVARQVQVLDRRLHVGKLAPGQKWSIERQVAAHDVIDERGFAPGGVTSASPTQFRSGHSHCRYTACEAFPGRGIRQDR